VEPWKFVYRVPAKSHQETVDGETVTVTEPDAPTDAGFFKWVGDGYHLYTNTPIEGFTLIHSTEG
jgi:hypothetical protein